MDGDVSAGFEEEAAAVAASEDGQRGWGGAQDEDAVAAGGGVAEGLGEGVGGLGGVGADDEGGEAAVGGPVAGAALVGFGGHEGGEVALDEGLHDGVFGGEGLEEDLAWGFGAAGAAGDLVVELDGSFGGAEVAAGEAEVGVDHADEGEVGEVPAFGDDLGADDEVDLAGLDAGGGLGGGVRAGHGVAGHDEDAGGWEGGGGFFGDAFDAGSDGDEGVVGAAAWALGGDGFVVAAVVAGELAAGAVLDEPGGAVGALHAVAAVAA